MPGVAGCLCRAAGHPHGHHLCELCLCQEAEAGGEYVMNGDGESHVDNAGREDEDQVHLHQPRGQGQAVHGSKLDSTSVFIAP